MRRAGALIDLARSRATKQEAARLTKAEIYNLFERRYGAGFAQWFIDQLDQNPV